MVRRACLLGALCALALTCGVAGALAEPSADAVLFESSASCPLAQDELRQLLALELAPRSLLGPSDPGAANVQTHARLVCDGATAHLSLADQGPRQHELQLDFTAISPAARPRLVALALAELLATADMETVQTPPAPAPTERVATRTPKGSAWLAAGVACTGEPLLLAPLLQTGSAWQLASLPLALQGELFASWGEHDLALGRVGSRALGGSLALAYAPRLAQLAPLLGLGLRAAHVQLDGRDSTRTEGAQARSVDGPVWGPLLSASASYPIHGRLGIRAGLELAYLLQRVQGLAATGGSLVSYGALQLHATLGVLLRI